MVIIVGSGTLCTECYTIYVYMYTMIMRMLWSLYTIGDTTDKFFTVKATTEGQLDSWVRKSVGKAENLLTTVGTFTAWL